MKILVTGSAGFIGQHLVVELRSHDHEVVGVDRADDQSHFHDLARHGCFASIIDKCAPQLVVHLAAQVGRIFGERDLRHTIESNATMTAIIAACCGERDIPILYASTSEVYGDQGDADCVENGPMVLPHNLYGLSKRWGEEVCRLYAPDDLKVCRFSMPYGPGVPPGRGRRALDNMLWQAHHGMPIPVHRGAERSWCWIGDTVAGIRAVIERGEGTYNIGRDDCAESLLTTARRAVTLAGAEPDLIDVIDGPANQTLVKRLSTEKLRSLGWAPTVEIDEGMAAVYEWVQHFDRNGQRS